MKDGSFERTFHFLPGFGGVTRSRNRVVNAMQRQLETSGTIGFMNGPIVYASYARQKTERSMMMNFKGLFSHFQRVLSCRFTTLAKDSRHAWILSKTTILERALACSLIDNYIGLSCPKKEGYPCRPQPVT